MGFKTRKTKTKTTKIGVTIHRWRHYLEKRERYIIVFKFEGRIYESFGISSKNDAIKRAAELEKQLNK